MSKEDMEKYRVLASETRSRSILRWFSTLRNAEWFELRDFVTCFALPERQGGELETLLRAIDSWERAGLKPSQIANLEAVLRAEVAKKWNSLDDLSIVGGSVPPLDEGESFPWSLLSRTYYLAPFQADHGTGGYLTITGPPRKGKTNIGCLYGEMWHDEYPESQVLTNIPLQDPAKVTPWVRPVTTMTSLLAGIADALNAERRWLWVFDEPSLSGWMKADAPTSRAKNLERFARIVPKMSGSFIYLEQRIEGVPTVIADFAQSHIYCDRPGFVIGDLPARKTALRAVPMATGIRYRTGEAGFFDIDIGFPWEGLFRALRYNPELQTMEDAPASTQGSRLSRFLETLTEQTELAVERPPVTCIYCGESWTPIKDGAPRRCPRCDKREPLGATATAE